MVRTVDWVTLWFSSDMHFGHARIIEYCARPFNSVFAMDKWLVSAWNDVVSDEDDVWVLGDVAMGNLSVSLRCVEQLNGKLRLVVGNHDKPFRREGQARPEWERRYMEAGFLEIYHEPISLNLEGLEVMMSHFPYVGDPHRPERFAEHRPCDIGGWLLHGHVHGRWTQRGRCIDVGVDAWGGRPVECRTVMSLISEGESDRPPLPWVLPSETSSLPGE